MMAAERSLLFCVCLCVCAESAEPGVYWRFRLWLGLPRTRTHKQARMPQHQEGTNQSKPTSKCATRVATKSLRPGRNSRRWVAGAVIPLYVVVPAAAALLALCSLLLLLSVGGCGFDCGCEYECVCAPCFYSGVCMCVRCAFCPHRQQEGFSAHSATADYIHRFFSYSGVGRMAGWLYFPPGVDTHHCLAAVMLL